MTRERPRVLHVYRDHFSRVPGGIERHVQELAAASSRELHVEILASARDRRSERVSDGQVTVHLVGEWARPGGVPVGRGYSRVIKRDFDLIHAHCPNPTGEVALSLARTQAARVATYHADLHRSRWLRPAYRAFLRRFLERSEKVIVSSEALVLSSTTLQELVDSRPGAIEVIPFGVDVDRFSPEGRAVSEEYRDSWGADRVVLFVGRLRHYKGLDVLIDAIAPTDAHLVVVGDGPEAERVRERGRSRLGNRFVHLGQVDDDHLPAVYRAADVFCLPSLNAAETFGIATVEAMASGLPVVTTEVGTATSRVNIHGDTGIVVPPGDPTALREALVSLLGDEDRRTESGLRARRRAVENYSLGAMVAATLDLYRSIVAG